MVKAIGYYSSNGYHVMVDNKEVYSAGNSPDDSQTYVGKDEGVGLETMKAYCEQTTRDIAKEHAAEYAGIEFDESEEEEMDNI